MKRRFINQIKVKAKEPDDLLRVLYTFKKQRESRVNYLKLSCSDMRSPAMQHFEDGLNQLQAAGCGSIIMPAQYEVQVKYASVVGLEIDIRAISYELPANYAFASIATSLPRVSFDILYTAEDLSERGAAHITRDKVEFVREEVTEEERGKELAFIRGIGKGLAGM